MRSIQLKRKYKWFSILFGVALLAFCVSLPAAKPMIEQSKISFIIDAGHGMPDGGAVGVDGTMEQTLNLQISQKLFALFPDNIAVMTRQDENGIYTSGNSIREKKISDMNERIAIAQKYKNAMIISVHMNTYPNQSVHGCQVFYRKEDTASKEKAELLQAQINQVLQPQEPKVAKPISNSLYLFKNTTNPAILIECGFISNEKDLNSLKDEAYQQKLADLIYNTINEDKQNGKS